MSVMSSSSRRVVLSLWVHAAGSARALRAGGIRMSSGATTVVFEPPVRSPTTNKLVLVGRKADLLSEGARALLPAPLSAALWTHLVESVDAGDDGDKASSVYATDDGQPATVVAAVLPDACSRHASPVRPHAVTGTAHDRSLDHVASREKKVCVLF